MATVLLIGAVYTQLATVVVGPLALLLGMLALRHRELIRPIAAPLIVAGCAMVLEQLVVLAALRAALETAAL